MNVGNALKVTCVGFAGGVLLRMVQMLYCFDYDTGFSTDGGVMAWISLLFTVGTSCFAGFLCFRSRRYFGAYVPRKNHMAGAVSVFSGVALLASAVIQTLGCAKYASLGGTGYGIGERQVIHTFFLITCYLFGAVQIFVSVGFFTGKNSLERVPLLYLSGVLWGVAYLIMVYVFYASAASFVENFFAIIGGAATLLCLFYLCKLFAGVDEEGAAKRVFVTGIFAVVLTVTYTLSNLTLSLLGKTYAGEIPPVVQLASLGVALFLLVFLVTFKKYSMRRAPAGGAEAAPAKRFRAD